MSYLEEDNNKEINEDNQKKNDKKNHKKNFLDNDKTIEALKLSIQAISIKFEENKINLLIL